MNGKFYLVLALTSILSLQSACADKNLVNDSTLNKVDDEKLDCVAKFNSGVCVDYKWDVFPDSENMGSFLLRAFMLPKDPNESITFIELPYKVTAMLWMPDMGHGSSPVTVENIELGKYKVSQVYFSMPGRWQIIIQLKDGKIVKDQAVIPIEI